MLNFLGLGQHVDIRVALDNEDGRKKEEFRTEDGQAYLLPVYYDGETVCGSVLIGMKRGNKLEHQGIRIEFLGVIEFYTDRGNRDEFIALSQDLARPGILSQPTTYPFEFSHIEKPHESYCGTNVRLRYLLRVTVQRRLTDLTNEREILVHSPARYLEPDTGIQMEVGIEDSLHIEFEYNKSKYHLQDVIVGKIYFQLVRVKIKNMEIQILKREILGSGPNAYSDFETLAKYEIMDGAPVRGESIPIRLFLHGYALTPTMRDVNHKFSVRFYLNLVLLDEEDRRYYKQQEIILYRKPDRRRKALEQSPCTPEVPLSTATPTTEADVRQKENEEYKVAPQNQPERTAEGDNHTSEEKDVFAERVSDSESQNAVVSTDARAVMETSDEKPTNQMHSGTSQFRTANEEEKIDKDVDSNSSESPDISRTARSMHRYEPKHDRLRVKSDETEAPYGAQTKQLGDVFIEESAQKTVILDTPESLDKTEGTPNHSTVSHVSDREETKTSDVA